MLYDGQGHKRSPAEQRHKLVLVPLIPAVLRAAPDATYRKVREKISQKRDAPIKYVEYWGLVAEVGKNRDTKVRVVLRRVGAGRIAFWSIMRLKKRKKDHARA